MKHITTDKGDIGVSKVIADLIEKGFAVFTPVSATCPFDLLIYTDSFQRVQVKYRSISKHGTVDIVLRRAIIKNGKAKYDKNEEVDIVAIYCPETCKCYYVNTNEISSSVSLRISNSQNGQIQGVKMASDYEQLR